MRSGTKWQFRTKRFRVSLILTRDHGYQYDGDDPDGETQAKLDSGEFVAFDSLVSVELDGQEIGADSLGGSVYVDGEESEFWTAHREILTLQTAIAAKTRSAGLSSVITSLRWCAWRLLKLAGIIREQPAVPYIRESA